MVFARQMSLAHGCLIRSRYLHFCLPTCLQSIDCFTSPLYTEQIHQMQTVFHLLKASFVLHSVFCFCQIKASLCWYPCKSTLHLVITEEARLKLMKLPKCVLPSTKSKGRYVRHPLMSYAACGHSEFCTLW